MKRAIVLLAFVSGCAGPLGALRVERPLALENARFTIKSDGTIDPDVQRIERALEKTPAGLERWGGIDAPVTVYLVNTHDDLESAVRKRGYGWLRAWSRYDDVIFQAPSTWTSSDEVVDELVLHELTHCLLFQRSGTATTWREKKIPLWFREGMAVVTAKQQRLYPSLEDAAHWVEQNPDHNIFVEGEALSEAHYLEVYGFSLHAFTFLERRYGAPHTIALMVAMHAGADFPTAFQQAMGTTLELFQGDFFNYLRYRAFRGSGRTLPLLRPNVRELLEKRHLGP